MLQKFRKKEIVEAVQWFPGKKIDGVREDSADPIVRTLDGDIIKTPEGYIKINSGDWIVDTSDGKQICRADQFGKMYEPVDTIDVVATLKELSPSDQFQSPVVELPITPEPEPEELPLTTKRPRRK